MIELTSKQISIIITLQDTFKKYMGKIQKGDRFIPIISEHSQNEVKICHKVSKYENPIEYFPTGGSSNTEFGIENVLLYPEVYPRDESQVQRSLIGMLGDDLRGFRRVNGNQWIIETYDKKPDSQVEPFVDDTIELALFQAILWKEGLYDKYFQKRKDY